MKYAIKCKWQHVEIACNRSNWRFRIRSVLAGKKVSTGLASIVIGHSAPPVRARGCEINWYINRFNGYCGKDTILYGNWVYIGFFYIRTQTLIVSYKSIVNHLPINGAKLASRSCMSFGTFKICIVLNMNIGTPKQERPNYGQ